MFYHIAENSSVLREMAPRQMEINQTGHRERSRPQLRYETVAKLKDAGLCRASRSIGSGLARDGFFNAAARPLARACWEDGTRFLQSLVATYSPESPPSLGI